MAFRLGLDSAIPRLAFAMVSILLGAVPFLGVDPLTSGFRYPTKEIVVEVQPFFDYQACERLPSCARLLGPQSIDPSLLPDHTRYRQLPYLLDRA